MFAIWNSKVLKGIKAFIFSSGIILLAAGLVRFLIATGSAQILSLDDPILGISIRYSALLVSAFELTVALVCLFGRRIGYQVGWLACLTTHFAAYRAGLLLMHWNVRATCLGSLADPLHCSGPTLECIKELLSFYLLIGSYAAVIALLILSKRTIAEPQAEVSELKEKTA